MHPEPPIEPTDAWPTPEHSTIVARRDTVVDAPPPLAPPPADRRIGQGMLLAIGVLVLIALGIVLAYILTHRQSSNATTTVVVTSASSSSPAAGPAIIPDVHGLSATQAQAGLKATGFAVRVVTVPSTEPEGSVIAQSPAGGASMARGSTVRINVSSGAKAASATTTGATTTAAGATTTAPPPPTTAAVPDVTSSKLQSAVQQLEAAGFLASIQYIPGTDPLGTIEHQSPSGGSSATTRSHVTINASAGPGQKTQETVPDTTGQTLPQAVSTLNGVQLRLIYEKVPVSDRSQAGKIVSQTPAAARQARENAQVLVYLGAFKPS